MAAEWLSSVMMGANKWWNGLYSRTIDVGDGLRFPYLEGGSSREIVLLIHGYGDSKETWIEYSSFLVKNGYRVLAPDLLGHGENDGHADADYGTAAQAHRLIKFLDRTVGKRYEDESSDPISVHVAGNSMGGWISLQLALHYPERVRSLTLICSAGVDGDQKSELDIAMERGEQPMSVESREDVDRMLNFALVNPPYIPWFYKDFIVQTRRRLATPLAKVLESLLTEKVDCPLVGQLKQISAPTLVLWGAEDRLVHVSSADVLEKNIPCAQKVVLEGVGHCPQVEAAEKAALAQTTFLQSLAAQNETS